jgi:hypothetical protein
VNLHFREGLRGAERPKGEGSHGRKSGRGGRSRGGGSARSTLHATTSSPRFAPHPLLRWSPPRTSAAGSAEERGEGRCGTGIERQLGWGVSAMFCTNLLCWAFANPGCLVGAEQHRNRRALTSGTLAPLRTAPVIPPTAASALPYARAVAGYRHHYSAGHRVGGLGGKRRLRKTEVSDPLGGWDAWRTGYVRLLGVEV